MSTAHDQWLEEAYLAAVAGDGPPDDGAAPDTVSTPQGLRDVNDMATAEHEAHRFERDVEHRHRMLLVNEAAARLLRAQNAAAAPKPWLLTDFLAVPDEPVQYRITDLFPVGGRGLLTAQFKAGKTTLIGNLVRSLADGVPFLGEHEVHATPGRVVLIDAELDPRMLRSWLRAHDIDRSDRVAGVNLRGRLSSFDITDVHVQREWAERIAELQPSMVILDCLRPVLDAIGLDEDKEAGQFLVAFDEMLEQAGAGEAIVVHHMGHNGERARGSSRLRDWPDVEWRLVRKDAEDPASARFFTAYGRDVDVPERELTYHHETRALSAWGGGSRRDGVLDQVLDDIRAELGADPGLTGSAIERRVTTATGATRANVRAALQRGISTSVIRTAFGPKNAIQHFVKEG